MEWISNNIKLFSTLTLFSTMINVKTYPINNVSLTNEVLKTYINCFWNEVFSEIKTTSYLMLLCKVQFENNDQGYRTLGHLVKANYDDKELFIDYLSERLSILNDSYVAHPILNINFSYVIKAGKCEDDNRALLLQDLTNKEIRFHNFNNMVLPITMNPLNYGKLILSKVVEENGVIFERFIVTSNNKTYQIDVYENGKVNKVTILGNIKLSWIDTKIDMDKSNFFKREIKKSTIYFIDGEIVLRKQELPAKPFRKLSTKNANLINDFYTMDIETIQVDHPTNENVKIVKPYLINAYNGRHHINSFNSDENQLFKGFMDKLISQIGSKTIIYAHNLSTFDGVLLLKHLLDYGKVDPIIHNGKIISINLKVFGLNRTKTIIFKDSMLLLPSSLRNLCLSFNVKTSKSYFPFDLGDIFYLGKFPEFEYWTDISREKWFELKNHHGTKMWSFRLESIKYCEIDCVSLHQVISHFTELIFNKFKVDVHKVLTLPALAMKIYKTHFMPENTIYQLSGLPEFNIRKSYSGGAVDVYIPHNIKGALITNNKVRQTLYSYDVNSLYPTIMANINMPIGKPIAFQGDIRKVDPDAYGFFYCKITTKEFMQHPILQRRIKTINGMRTVAGLGSWDGWLFSYEMDNAMKYGYTFEIIKGYQFEKGNIFKDYVETLYNLRMNYPKTHPMNPVAKFLMNALYGKFGMKNELTEVEIFNCSTPAGQELFNDKFNSWAESLIDQITIGDHKILVRNTLNAYKYDETNELSHHMDNFHGMETNIAIASAVTAGARVFMSHFKNNKHFKLYYSDTDSIIIDCELPAEFIGNNLGQFKLEYIIKRAVFLAPKVYGFIDVNENQIIKIKGVNNIDISLGELELLLIQDSTKEFKQFKWFKEVLQGNITIKEQVYHLKSTSNKRAPIYIDENGYNVYSSTRPYNYNELIYNNPL